MGKEKRKAKADTSGGSGSGSPPEAKRQRKKPVSLFPPLVGSVECSTCEQTFPIGSPEFSNHACQAAVDEKQVEEEEATMATGVAEVTEVPCASNEMPSVEGLSSGSEVMPDSEPKESIQEDQIEEPKAQSCELAHKNMDLKESIQDDEEPKTPPCELAQKTLDPSEESKEVPSEVPQEIHETILLSEQIEVAKEVLIEECPQNEDIPFEAYEEESSPDPQEEEDSLSEVATEEVDAEEDDCSELSFEGDAFARSLADIVRITAETAISVVKQQENERATSLQDASSVPTPPPRRRGRPPIIRTCPQCTETFTSKKLLHAHIEGEHANAVLDIIECHVCGTEQESLPALEEHLATQHKDVLSFCKLCRSSFDTEEEHTDHVLEVHLTCAWCRKTFKTDAGRDRHVVKTCKKNPAAGRRSVQSEDDDYDDEGEEYEQIPKKAAFECQKCTFETNNLRYFTSHHDKEHRDKGGEMDEDQIKKIKKKKKSLKDENRPLPSLKAKEDCAIRDESKTKVMDEDQPLSCLKAKEVSVSQDEGSQSSLKSNGKEEKKTKETDANQYDALSFSEAQENNNVSQDEEDQPLSSLERKKKSGKKNEVEQSQKASKPVCIKFQISERKQSENDDKPLPMEDSAKVKPVENRGSSHVATPDESKSKMRSLSPADMFFMIRGGSRSPTSEFKNRSPKEVWTLKK